MFSKVIKKKNIIKLLTILLLFMSSIMIYKTQVYAENDFSGSVSEIVLEVKTNRVLFENNSYEKKYMASTTKILTCICAIENSDIDKDITVTKDTIGIEGSSIYLEEGEVLTIRQLLYGLMLRSGNDTAETIAKNVSGSVKEFAKLMNETAKRIGANNSNFVNPHGLHDDNHYTTAYDLALITSYALKNQTFKEIVSTKKTTIPFTTRNTKRVLINKNKILSSLDGATGVKTGFTKKAGRCLVSSCNRNGNEVVCVVLNCPPMFERSTNLINDAFNNYGFYKVIESDQIIDFIDIKDSKEKCGLICKNDVILPLTRQEKEKLHYKLQIPEIINKNEYNSNSLGKISFLIANNLIFEEKLYTILSEI